MSGRVVVPKVIEMFEYPWGFNVATANGIQYTATPSNVTADGTNRAVGAKAFNAFPFGYPGGEGILRMLEAAVTVAIASPDNATASVQWKLQGRKYSNNAVNEYAWIDMSDTISYVPGAGYTDSSIFGRLICEQTNFGTVPFELQAVYQANTANVVRAKIKNSSYVSYLYTIS